MLRILSGLRKIRIGILQEWILIAMPKLSGKRSVSAPILIVLLHRALARVLIFPILACDTPRGP